METRKMMKNAGTGGGPPKDSAAHMIPITSSCEGEEGVWKRIIRVGDKSAPGTTVSEAEEGAQGRREHKMLLMFRGYRQVEGGGAEYGDTKAGPSASETAPVEIIEGRKCQVFAEWMDYREAVEVVAAPRGIRDLDDDGEDEHGEGAYDNKSCRGLRLAVRTMKPFERAIITVSPSFGYGSKGSFSFPHIPPNSWLVYDVVVMNWEPVALGGKRGNMVFESRLKAADHHRASGNEYFRAAAATATGRAGHEGNPRRTESEAGSSSPSFSSGDQPLPSEEDGEGGDAGDARILWAKLCYSAGLSYFSDDVMLQIQDAPKYITEANALRHPLHLNVAACNIMVRS